MKGGQDGRGKSTSCICRIHSLYAHVYTTHLRGTCSYKSRFFEAGNTVGDHDKCLSARSREAVLTALLRKVLHTSLVASNHL
jgi:hypothetical protein